MVVNCIACLLLTPSWSSSHACYDPPPTSTATAGPEVFAVLFASGPRLSLPDRSAAEPFLLLNDHKSLEYNKTAKRLNMRQSQCSLFFSCFNFQVTYRLRSKNGKADTPSRLYEINLESSDEPATILPTSSWLPCSGTS